MIDARITKWSRIEVIFWSLMIGMGEAYIGAYALACGFSERYAGLIATIPLGTASIIQLFSPKLMGLVKGRRHFVIGCAVAQAFTLFLITGHAIFDRGSPTVLIAVLTLYWLFGLSAGPMWNAWIVAIIPKEHRAHFFSQRGPYHEISVLIGLVVCGLALDRTPDVLFAFSITFVLAGVSRLVSAFSMNQLPDEPATGAVRFESPSDLGAFLNWLRQKKVLWMILLIGFLNLGVSVGSPFFTPFMLKRMKLDYSTYMMLIAIPFISRAIAYQYFEKIVHRVGVKTALIPSMVIIALTPFLWSQFPYVGAVVFFQLLAGVAWTGFEYSILLKQISDFGQAERSRVLTWTNFVVGACNIVGVSLGSQLLGRNPSPIEYARVFEISTLMRFFPIFV
ncbi:MAG: MFS transporter, partial [Bdellovibrionales bacterium]|nr:MFS transporter [Bdellovibrionales bacterium]